MFKYLLSFFLFFTACSQTFAGYPQYYNYGYYRQPVYYYYYQPRVIVHEKFTFPIRETQYTEVKGLRVLEDTYGNKFYEVDGTIVSSDKAFVKEAVQEKLKGDKVIIERTFYRE